MIVRTYARRKRGELPPASPSHGSLEAEEDDIFGITLSNSQNDMLPFSSRELHLSSVSFPFSSQDSSSLDDDSPPYRPIPPVNKLMKRPRITSSTTLLEAQEFGEMMEHVDEVHFALDGLRISQPVRIRRASLLSLLGICGTLQQRRLLRTQGLTQMIMNACLTLGFDDASCNLAASALFYLLFDDGQDDHLMESPENMRFLLKFLEPVTSTVQEANTLNIGSKILAMNKNSSKLDASSKAIAAKVEELLVNRNDLKACRHSYRAIGSADSCAKWIALLTMEKACLTKISIEDLSGSCNKIGGEFKEKLRDMGGLDATFEVVNDCLFDLENLVSKSISLGDRSEESCFKSLELLLKCLKLMENATFLSGGNQLHLLELKGKADQRGRRSCFAEILIKIAKILSALFLQERASIPFINSYEHQENGQDVVYISSSEDHCNAKESRERIITNKNSSFSSMGGLCFSNGVRSLSESLMKYTPKLSNSNVPLSCSFNDEDPFAFDENDIEPSKWETLQASKNQSRPECFIKESPTEHKPDSQAEFSSLLFDCIHSAVKVLMNLTNENPMGCKLIASCGGLEAMSSLIAWHFPSFNPTTTNSKADHTLTDPELDFLVSILGLLVNLVEKDGTNRSRLAAISVISSERTVRGTLQNVIPLLCSIFLMNHNPKAGNSLSSDDAAAVLQGEKEAEKMIVEAYSALLLAFLSTESELTRRSIAKCLPKNSMGVLVPILERFVAFHMTLNVISSETHKAVVEVIESCRVP